MMEPCCTEKVWSWARQVFIMMVLARMGIILVRTFTSSTWVAVHTFHGSGSAPLGKTAALSRNLVIANKNFSMHQIRYAYRKKKISHKNFVSAGEVWIWIRLTYTICKHNDMAKYEKIYDVGMLWIQQKLDASIAKLFVDINSIHVCMYV